MDKIEKAACNYEEIIPELELAIAHVKTVAAHFRSKELARAGAHAFAVKGHLEAAQRKLADLSIEHAANSRP